jgi:hypothetical protein
MSFPKDVIVDGGAAVTIRDAWIREQLPRIDCIESIAGKMRSL